MACVSWQVSTITNNSNNNNNKNYNHKKQQYRTLCAASWTEMPMQSSPPALPTLTAEVPQHQKVPYLERDNERGQLPLVSSPPAKSSASSGQIAHIVGIQQKSNPRQVTIAPPLFPRGG